MATLETFELTTADLSTLCEALQPVVAKWYDIGLQMKISSGRLDAIRADYMNDGGVRACLREMLKLWLKSLESEHTPTWPTLIAVLRKKWIEENQLATELEKAHCPHQHVHVQPSDEERQEVPHANSGSSDLIEGFCEAEGVPPHKLDEKCDDIDVLLEINQFFDWQATSPALNVDVSDLTQEKGKEGEKRWKALQRWRETSGDSATYRSLMEAMLKAGKTDQAIKVFKVFKKNLCRTTTLFDSDSELEGKLWNFKRYFKGTPSSDDTTVNTEHKSEHNAESSGKPLDGATAIPNNNVTEEETPVSERSDEPEDVDMSSRPAVIDSRAAQSRHPAKDFSLKKKILRRRSFITGCVCLLSFALISVSIWLLIARTIANITQPAGSVYISPNTTVLITNEGLDPFYVGTVSITSVEAENETVIVYLERCNELQSCNSTVMEQDLLEIIAGRNMIDTRYLLRDSELTYRLTMNQAISGCDTVLYTIKTNGNDIKPMYNIKLGQDGSQSNLTISSPDPFKSVCMTNRVTNVTITANEASYYSTEIYRIPQQSVSMDYEVSGDVFYLNASEISDNCKIIPGGNKTCSFSLDPVPESTANNSYCVLGQVVDATETYQLMYTVRYSIEMPISYIASFAWPISLFAGIVVGLSLVYVCVLECTCTWCKKKHSHILHGIRSCN